MKWRINKWKLGNVPVVEQKFWTHKNTLKLVATFSRFQMSVVASIIRLTKRKGN